MGYVPTGDVEVAVVVKVAVIFAASCGRMPVTVPLMAGIGWPYKRVMEAEVAVSAERSDCQRADLALRGGMGLGRLSRWR